MPTDHLVHDEVRALVARIDAEQGRLDVLVNDIWGGEMFAEWNNAKNYRLSPSYDVAKVAANRMAWAHARDLAKRGATAAFITVAYAGKAADAAGYR